MPLPWFNLTEVRAFANRLVDDLHRVKAGGAARGEKMHLVVRRIEKLIGQAADFERARHLNIYQRARLLTLVRSGLTAKGWTESDTDVIVGQLMTSRLRRPTT